MSCKEESFGLKTCKQASPKQPFLKNSLNVNHQVIMHWIIHQASSFVLHLLPNDLKIETWVTFSLSVCSCFEELTLSLDFRCHIDPEDELLLIYLSPDKLLHS